MLVEKFKNLKILSLLMINYETNGLDNRKILLGAGVLAGVGAVIFTDRKNNNKNSQKPNKNKFHINFDLTINEFEKDFKNINNKEDLYLYSREGEELKSKTLEKLEILSKEINNGNIKENKKLMEKIKKEISAYKFFYSDTYHKVTDLVDTENCENAIKKLIDSHQQQTPELRKEVLELKNKEIEKIVKTVEDAMDKMCKNFIDSSIYKLIKKQNSIKANKDSETIVNYTINSNFDN